MSRAALGVLVAAALQVFAGAQAPPGLVKDGYYVLQKGDEIDIKVFQQSQLDETVRVRPDGRISAMLLDDLLVAGLTTRELREQLTANYAKLFREPQVSVIVKEFANLKIYVGGEVGQPGALPLVGDMTALAAVLQAGGMKPTAKPEGAVLLRNEGGKPVATRIDLEQIVKHGAADVPLQPFDVVYVPRSKIATVDRAVDQYVRQLIPLTLTAGFSYILGNNVVVR
jgi:protein involved in polysaccharide export with SLBB domain